MEKEKECDRHYVSFVGRNHTMTPKSNKNLSLLEQEFDRFGKCQLMPIEMKNGVADISRDFLGVFYFSKLIFKNAFEIAVGDEEEIALMSNDNPYIPDCHKDDAPVLKVLERLKRMRNNCIKNDEERCNFYEGN
jgi:hypothetical protein